MIFSIDFTKQYLKDLKLARKRNLDENKLNDIIQKLINNEALPEKNKDHALKGDYVGFRECHITPDWILIYNKNFVVQIVTLVRTGSHSDLF